MEKERSPNRLGFLVLSLGVCKYCSKRLFENWEATNLGPTLAPGLFMATLLLRFHGVLTTFTQGLISIPLLTTIASPFDIYDPYRFCTREEVNVIVCSRTLQGKFVSNGIFKFFATNEILYLIHCEFSDKIAPIIGLRPAYGYLIQGHCFGINFAVGNVCMHGDPLALAPEIQRFRRYPNLNRNVIIAVTCRWGLEHSEGQCQTQ